MMKNNRYSQRKKISKSSPSKKPQKIICGESTIELLLIAKNLYTINKDILNLLVKYLNSEDLIECTIWSNIPKKSDQSYLVEWEDFLLHFSKIMNFRVGDPKYELSLKGVQVLLDAGQDKWVKRGKWMLFNRWFNPIKPVRMVGRSTLEDVVELLSQPWFYGDISSFEASNLLRREQPGTFLIRFSQSPDAQFTISFTFKRDVLHYRLPFPLSAILENKSGVLNKDRYLVQYILKPFADSRPEKIACFNQYPKISLL